METGASRRWRSLSDEKLDSQILRDFLRVKDDDDDSGGSRKLAGPTLSAVLSDKRPPPPVAQVNRTLLDMIRDDPNGGKESKKSWKTFKDKLCRRRAGAAWTSSVPIPASDVPIQNANRMISHRNSTRFPASSANSDDPTQPELSSSSNSVNEFNSMPSNRAMMLRRNSSRVPSLSANRYGRGANSPAAELDHQSPSDEEEESEEGGGEVAEAEAEGAAERGEPEVRMSLMALLEETDREMGLDGSTFMMDDDDEEDEESVGGGVGVGDYNNCCVCMVRHKGAAFIPCGHTFCRLCSRELWVQRGNCPLCNGFILEILDIF
ncbi:RING/U-box superfamily protein [Actinidia rufa]|uniref:RING/U-box superfamily protein n=1 Tax=Actinidia rufa TaxID=165716 RepID=A0A7J0FKZ4_9ERIC|nr:RING/U-box superfamily protein [Actinidia rufa]